MPEWSSWVEVESCPTDDCELKRIQRFERTNPCKATETKFGSCPIPKCCPREWKPWSQWTACSDSCSESTRERFSENDCDTIPAKREYTICPKPEDPWGPIIPTGCNGPIINGHQCAGTIFYEQKSACGQEKKWTEPCGSTVAIPGAPQPWSECSRKCRSHGGYRTRTVIDDICPPTVSRVEREACGIEGDWVLTQDWSECSNSCGGKQYQQYTHECMLDYVSRKKTKIVERDCGAPTEWGAWTQWGAPSGSCPGAIKTRKRNNVCGVLEFGRRVFEQIETSDATIPDPGYTPGAWSECKSVENPVEKCGAGLRSQILTNPCKPGEDEVVRESCQLKACCTWMAWSGWSNCPIPSCGGEVRERKRASTCPNIASQTETWSTNACDIDESYKPWTAWSACSTSCPNGYMTRTRSPVCDSYKANWFYYQNSRVEVERETCGSTTWLAWSEWSSCSKSLCTDGKRVRSRHDACRSRPSQYEETVCPAVIPPPEEWANWSRCSQSCPGGRKIRTRIDVCKTGVEVFQETTCGVNPGSLWSAWSVCNTCEQYSTKRDVCTGLITKKVQDCEMSASPWTDWSPRYFVQTFGTPTCEGTQTRTQYHPCRKPEIQSRPWFYNSQPNAPKNQPWSQWSSCSQTCTYIDGVSGTRIRKQEGICGNPAITEQESCNNHKCCYESKWTVWGACSTSCGPGIQSRVKYSVTNMMGDPNGERCQDKEIAFETQPCPRVITPAPPGPWSPCSASCGVGTRTRSTPGYCGAADIVETEICQAKCRCSYWAGWSHNQCEECATSVTRTRPCILEDKENGCLCEPDPMTGFSSTKVDACPIPAEPLVEPFGPWSVCSANCRWPGMPAPTRTRVQNHKCSSQTNVETEICNDDPGLWMAWSDPTTCELSCSVPGFQTRFRTQSCTNAIEEERIQCPVTATVMTEWTPTEDCPVTQCGAMQTWERKELCGPDVVGVESQQRICGAYRPPGLISDWSECTKTCIKIDPSTGEPQINAVTGKPDGPGVQFRTTTYQCGEPTEVEERNCGFAPCPYSVPGPWSACSTSCFAGQQTRYWRCIGGIMGQSDGCMRSSIETKECYNPNVAGPWSSWSSTDLWTYIQHCQASPVYRTRSNSCLPDDTQTQIIPANAEYFKFAQEWDEIAWSPCDKQCGLGKRYRSRTNKCQETEEQEETCQVIADEWTPYGEWSECSKSCGSGTQFRSRYNTCNRSLVDTEERICNTQFCAYFGAWSTWGPCSRSCGLGIAKRYRYCHGGEVGTGLCIAQEQNGVLTEDEIKCDMGECCEWDWSGWTGCCNSNSVDGNVRLRFRGNTCGMETEMIQKPCEAQQQALSVPNCQDFVSTLQRTSSSVVAAINPDVSSAHQVIKGKPLGHADNQAQVRPMDFSWLFGPSRTTTLNGRTISLDEP